MQRIHHKIAIALLAGVLSLAGVLTIRHVHADGLRIGVNVLLKSTVTETLLADLSKHGRVLDVIPEIKAVTLNAEASELPTIQHLSYVAAANPDRERYLGRVHTAPKHLGMTLFAAS